MNHHQPFPASIARIIDSSNEGDGINVVWSELSLVETLDVPFQLPGFSPSFDSVPDFVAKEIKLQVEMMRDDLSRRVHRCENIPRTDDNNPEKHLRFPMPDKATPCTTLPVHSSVIQKEPEKGQFTNYVVLFQCQSDNNNTMQNLTLAYCNYLRKKDGAQFTLGKDYRALFDVPAGRTIYVRVLRNFNMLKTHIDAIFALKGAAPVLDQSYVTSQLLQGRIAPHDVHRISDLDQWISNSNQHSSRRPFDLSNFNRQQQRALALEALTNQGVVMIQGPPGTGKSHIVCHGVIPQAAVRNERVLVICNSNVAVDALMLKCVGVESLKNRMLRCGFKANVSDEITNLGLYAEGNLDQAVANSYGKLPGANSDTFDTTVQSSIRGKQIIFTTIHFASKKKGASDGQAYWNFDTLVLDEAAQIEDSKLFIVLARCPSLNKIVFVGDPKQIQPYISDTLRKQGLGKSTMERLMESTTSTHGSCHFVMLERQFRMAPPLREIVSHLFYNNRLEDGDCVLTRGPVSSINLQPLLVVNVTGTRMTFSRLHQSYENRAEAAIVKVVYDFLFSAEFYEALPDELQAKDVCILTPFNRHKDRLRNLVCGIAEENLDSYGGQIYGPTLGSPAKKSQSLVGTQEEVDPVMEAMIENIDTVDKFQGSERKAVIISTCVDRRPLRASDEHFINVACSRAQHLLIVVGNFSHGLAADRNWSHVMDQARSSGSYIEHAATMLGDSEDEFNIHTDVLLPKLQALLERPKKSRRIDV